MTHTEAERLLATLKAAYPGATLPPDTIQLWMNVLAPVTWDDALAAVEAVIAESMFFPTVAEFNRHLSAARHDQAVNEAALAAIKCGGDGWINDRPCPTCNPALARVFSDERLLTRWKHGQRLHELLEMSLGEFKEQYQRPTCDPYLHLGDYEDSSVLPPSDGYQIAAEAYEQDCRRLRRDPNWTFFDAVFSRAVARARQGAV